MLRILCDTNSKPLQKLNSSVIQCNTLLKTIPLLKLSILEFISVKQILVGVLEWKADGKKEEKGFQQHDQLEKAFIRF